MASPQISLPKRDTGFGKTNGTHENGVNGGSSSALSSPSISAYRSHQRGSSYTFRTSSVNGSTTGDISTNHLLASTAQVLEKRSAAELGMGVSQSISSLSFIELVEYIRAERLSSLPHKGSKWDKVLIKALYFAQQLHTFEMIIKGFSSEDVAVPTLGYGFTKLLLELGHENADALDTALDVLYKHSLDVSILLQRTEVLTATTSQIREHIYMLYGDLLTLASSVATRYYKIVHGMASTTISLDINDVCGDVIQGLRERKAKATELIWLHQAQITGTNLETGISVKTLQRWLSPADQLLSTISEDYGMYLESQADFTCLWFQKPLTSFVQGTGKVMAITGPDGSGKTVLSASIAERLQRAIGRKSCTTLYYSIKSTVPATSNPINILKSLLAQIFNLRIGNMQTYHAIARAYELSRVCHKSEDFAEHLWNALDHCLKRPLDNAKDLVIVINGLDEIQGGKTASQAFFEKLAETTCDGKGVKLIGLAQTLSMPSGIDTKHVHIGSSQIHDDLHSVILRGLVHCRNLTTKPGPEQEQIINKVVHASQGSFVLATLLAESLSRQHSSDDFLKLVKSLENAKMSVDDLVLSTASWQELSDVSRMILTWLTTSERPLTVTEIQSLIVSDVQKPNSSLKDTDLTGTLEPLKTYLTFYGGIVRFKNQSFQKSISSLIERNKITTPIKSRHVDFLLRILNATKQALPDDTDPSFEEIDYATLERACHQHPLLQYTLNYWTLLVNTIGQSKLPQELSKVLPTTALWPMFERTLWTYQIPLSQVLDYINTGTTIRQSTLKDSNYSVLQSRLNVAIVYEMLQRPDDAAPIYFAVTRIARSVLSEHHPLAVECGIRFLAITESKVTTSRTEIVTMREETMQILIYLYERQFGKTSQQVIEMLTMLAELYVHIHEEQKSTEVYTRIKATTVQLYGQSSTEARDASDHLKIVLGRTKNDKIQPRADSIFDEEDDEVDESITDIVDINNIDQLIIEAKTERQLVELWQRVAVTCRSTNSLAWHEKNIQVAQAYSSHLASQKRTTEASAVLTSTAREYSSSHMVRSDSIVSRLTEVATSLKSMKSYSAALSIYKRTAEYFASHQRHESSQMTQIQREISSVSTEMIQSGSTEVSQEEIFRSLITNKTKEVDIKIMQLCHSIVTTYMQQSRLTDATEIIFLALHRTWPTWFNVAPNDVGMPVMFSKESIELVKLLAQCYVRMRHIETIEIVYSKLLHAVLSPKTPDFTLVKEIQQLLTSHYDRYNHPEKSITTLEKVLTVYKAHSAHDNDTVIDILYDLATRTRRLSRTFPFWIEYYQQIANILNKGSDVIHPRAMDATLIVATSYWDDRRFSEAVVIYRLIWNTFTQKPKQCTEFSKEDFVMEIYERYITSLEQTGASHETIYQVSVRHREVCISTFGAKSTSATRATVSLAEICATSESHSSEALKWYEDVHKNSGNLLAERKWQVTDAISSLYSRQVITQTSRSVDASTLESARARTSEQYSSEVSKYGYAHESSLKSLHELATLYHRQQKVEAVQKELTKSVSEIVTKEMSAVQTIQAAESIVQTYQACQMTSQCQSMVAELQRQIIAKDRTNVSKAGFDVTRSSKGGALSFLVAMMCTLDATLSSSQLLAELSVLMWLYEEYRKTVDSDESLQTIIINGSSLRAFLVKTQRTELVDSLDNEISALFISRDGSKMELLSQKSAKIFIVAIVEFLGVRKSKNFVKAVILASNHRLNQLIGSEQYTEAYDIAKLALTFALFYDGYNSPKGISYGFNLASTLVGIGSGKKTSNPELRKKMLQLSNDIVKKVLEVCKKQGIGFGQIQLRELNRLVSLLGEQEDYETLEWLLTTLWNTREAQSTWPPQVLHALARRLICARYLSGHPIKALRLCEDVAYNMRRTHGAGHSATREMNMLLAQLYTSSGQYYLQNYGKDKSSQELAAQYFSKALQVHEDMLNLLANDSDNDGHDDDDDVDSTGAILAAHGVKLGGTHSQISGLNGATKIDQGASAKEHVQLLKLAYQRLGSWPKSYNEYEGLIARIFETYPAEMKDVARPDKWQVKGFGGGKAESDQDSFVKADSWQLLDQAVADQNEISYA